VGYSPRRATRNGAQCARGGSRERKKSACEKRKGICENPSVGDSREPQNASSKASSLHRKTEAAAERARG